MTFEHTHTHTQAAECSGGEAGSITVMGTLDLPGATFDAMVPITVLGQVMLSNQGYAKRLLGFSPPATVLLMLPL